MSFGPRESRRADQPTDSNPFSFYKIPTTICKYKIHTHTSLNNNLIQQQATSSSPLSYLLSPIIMPSNPSTSPPLSFTVRRRDAVLVPPAKPTPHEFKLLSDVDDQEGLRFHIPVIQFYRNHPPFSSMAAAARDPARVIKDALAEALVFYYPFAGRLREGAGRKLAVECTGEGVVFIEADADVSLEQFGDSLHPPFPCLDQLLYDVPGTTGVLHCPLLLIQLTRLTCGGFVFALRLNHTMSDAQGLVLFMTAVSELARGASAPSVLPVWDRHLFSARDPPRVTFAHREYDEVADTKGTIVPLDQMLHRSFFFGAKEIAALRSLVPPHLRSCSTFELLTACLWRCRTIAIEADPEEQVRMICIVSARGKFQPPIPDGYYGNSFVFPVAMAAAGELCKNPLGYALERVSGAKREATQEYMQSVADLMVMRGRPHFGVVRTYVVSDVTRAGFEKIDYGWGKPVYGGPAKGGVGAIPGLLSFYIPYWNKGRGENGIAVPCCLPAPAMERLAAEIEKLTTFSNAKENDKKVEEVGSGRRKFISSPL